MTNAEGRGRAADYDLEDRTGRFGEAVIAFAKRVLVNVITTPLISQLVRAGSSVGANYCEPDEAESGKEFAYRIGVCKREAKESKHQIRMLVAAQPELRDDARALWQEAKELTLIFAAIIRRYRSN